MLFDGYHRRPELTLSRFTNAWFHTGDLGAFDDDGYLHFHGRTDETIRRGGENISPRDLQQTLTEHPDIAEAAVVGVPDPVMGEEIKLVVVPRGKFCLTELPGYLDGRLPRFAWPRYVEVVDALPKTPTQKIRIDLLRSNGPGVVDLKTHTRNGAD